MPLYNPATVEPKWQRFWEENATFQTPRLPSDSAAGSGEKLYVLDMFPYPSGEGLHVGHPEGYTATDIFCRHWRMRGKTVLHPMGFDSFGLPAEEYAIKNNEQPRGFTEKNIATFVRQLKSLGFSYDWSRQLATTDVEYFRWTQWIFLVLFDTWFDEQTQKGRPIAELPIPDDVQKQGEAVVEAYRDERRLAFQSHAPVNWCPDLGTVLANEEVIDGKSERGGYPVQRIPLRQWMLKITAYADRLEKDLETVDWPESVKALQRNWIGKSIGAEVDFFLPGDGGPDAGTKAFENWKQARKKSGFPRKAGDDTLRVYTTRPDTLFGATYMVLAPEHPLVDRLTTTEHRGAVEDYQRKAGGKSDLERTELAKEKTGVYTGACAINPLNGQRIPIWIADYVLISYGSGAIMAVPAHDERDCEFALKYDLPIVPVVQPPAGYEPSEAEKALSHDKAGATALPYFGGEGAAINSGPYDGTPTKEFKPRVAQDLEAAGLGRAATNYKLRDWLFSRQRFWGEPFPILHELDAKGEPTGRVRAVPVDQLPVDLPHLDDFKPHGRPEPPLGKSPEEWLYVTLDGKRYRRETNTMPQWAGSCWYYLRFLDPKNDQAFVDPEIEKAWMPVDLYIGGAEHAVLHLLYARFWHKVLFDRGYLSTPEPFRRLINQGMILGEMEFTLYALGSAKLAEPGTMPIDVKRVEKNVETGQFVDSISGARAYPIMLGGDDVEKRGDAWVWKAMTDIRVDARSYKMSKSRGNVINPDTIIRDYGADSLRLYEMFMGPLEATKPWDMNGVSGVRKFLDRSWRLIIDAEADGGNADAEAMTLHPSVQDVEPTADQLRILHQTIGKVTADTETLSFNTAIARMMEFVNYFTPEPVRPKAVLEPFVLLLSPYAPHLAEELWAALGHTKTLAYEPWPEFRADLAAESAVEIPVQINGKTKTVLSLPTDATKAQIESAARADERVLAALAGKEPTKVIVVEKGATKLVSFVVK